MVCGVVSIFALFGIISSKTTVVSGSSSDVWKVISRNAVTIDGISEHSGNGPEMHEKWLKLKTLRRGGCPFKHSQMVRLPGLTDFYAKICLPDAPLSPSAKEEDAFEQDLLMNILMAPMPVEVAPQSAPPGAHNPTAFPGFSSSAIWLTGNDSLVLCVFLAIIISAYMFQPI